MSTGRPEGKRGGLYRLRRRVPWLALLFLLGAGTVTRAAEVPPVAEIALGASKSKGKGRPMTETESCCCSICFVLFVIALFLSGGNTRVKAKTVQQKMNASNLLPNRLEALKSKDPSFELELFLGHAKSLFEDVQEALFRRDLGGVRESLTDATYQRLYTQLQIQRFRGNRRVLAEVQVKEHFLLGMEQNDTYDVAHVLFRFKCRRGRADTDTSDEDALKQARRVGPEDSSEVWSFIRYSPAPPRHAEPRSAWLLSGISSGRRFVNDGEVGLPGSRELRKTDPDLTLQLINDRAALVFWKWLEALQQEEPGRFTMLCSEGFLEGLKRYLADLRQRDMRIVFAETDVTVRATKLRAHPDGFELAEVEVLWSGTYGEVPRSRGGKSQPHLGLRWTMTLRRRRGATTPPLQGASRIPCPHCSHPTDALVPVCGNCGGLVPRNEEDWVLIQATGPERP
jgi:hypothetical protein